MLGRIAGRTGCGKGWRAVKKRASGGEINRRMNAFPATLKIKYCL
jgi:hypothetical protein